MLAAPDEATRAEAAERLAPLVAEAMGVPESGGPLLEVVAAPRGVRSGWGWGALNPNYTFDNFVIGPSNRLAHAAALAVSSAPAAAYNPLFVHSGVGLGKTHLLQAVCHKLLAGSRPPVVLYTSCDELQSRYLSAVQEGRTDEFRDWARRAEVLVVDDIHFLSQKERTQEEFFHIFNSLYNARRQIILSSDSPPDEIPAVEERLVSRFRWGLVAEIEPPTHETTVEIIRRKAMMRSVELPEPVVQMIASSGAANIREIEGRVVRLLGYAALLDAEIDEDLAAEVLAPRGRERRPARRVSLDEVQRAVADFFDLSVPDLQSKSRARSVARARHIAMYLCRELTGASLKETGGHFGGRDHSTVKYACDKIADEMSRGGSVARVVEEIRRAVLSRSGGAQHADASGGR